MDKKIFANNLAKRYKYDTGDARAVFDVVRVRNWDGLLFVTCMCYTLTDDDNDFRHKYGYAVFNQSNEVVEPFIPCNEIYDIKYVGLGKIYYEKIVHPDKTGFDPKSMKINNNGTYIKFFTKDYSNMIEKIPDGTSLEKI